MSEIVLTNQLLSRQSFKEQCGIELNQLRDIHGHTPEYAISNTPYLLEPASTASNSSSAAGLSALNQFASGDISRNLTNLSLSLGGDNVLALAEMKKKLYEFSVGSVGAATSLHGNRVNGFLKTVEQYQNALMQYRQAIETKSPHRLAAQQKVDAAYKEMQTKFHYEMDSITAQVKSRRGTALTNLDRGKNIARSSRNVTKLNVTSQAQASDLVQFSKYSKLLGNGLAVIDFTSRIGNIKNTFRAGSNWHRQMFIESISFVASATVGTLAVHAGSYGLGLLIAATPVGWIGLIIGGAAVVGAAAGSSMYMNNLTQNNSGAYYDEIMAWINK